MQTIQIWSQPVHIPTNAFHPLKYNCSYHGNHINISSRAANTYRIINGKSSPFIACLQLYSKRYVSLTDYPIASDNKPAHRILSLTRRKCRGKPNIWILLPLLQKNKYGCSQLYRDHIFSNTVYLYNRKFDWCLIVHPVWLVWHTSLIHPLITYLTRRLRGIFLQKK